MADSLRDEWKFTYQASALADAAHKKLETHERKLQWWQKRADEVMEEIRSHGIEVAESAAAGYSFTKGNFGPQVTVDDKLTKQLTECHSKAREHEAHIAAYKGWVQVLAANAHKQLDLTHDDWLYFFGE